MSVLDREFTELLSSVGEGGKHELVHIMREEAARIGLDIRDNLSRIGIGQLELDEVRARDEQITVT